MVNENEEVKQTENAEMTMNKAEKETANTEEVKKTLLAKQRT